MALRFADSFDHYATGDLLLKWSSMNGNTASITISSGAGRFSNGLSLNDVGAGSTAHIFKTIDSQQDWIVGFAYRNTINSTSQPLFFLSSGGSTQLDLRIDGSGHLFLTRNGTTLSTGTTVLSVNVFYYIELKAHIATGTSGTYELRINGITEFSSAGANTSGTGGTTANQIAFGTPQGGSQGTRHVDDVYACDGTGSVNNDFLGDVKVEAQFPDGNGTHSQFSGSDGNSTDNYLLVDDAQPSGDTDYVADATVGDEDTYSFQDPTPTAGTVYGVQISHYSRKTDAGTRSARSLARLAGTETDNGADQPLSTSYVYYSDIRETKPGGGSWSLSDLANAEFGVKVAA